MIFSNDITKDWDNEERDTDLWQIKNFFLWAKKNRNVQKKNSQKNKIGFSYNNRAKTVL